MLLKYKFESVWLFWRKQKQCVYLYPKHVSNHLEVESDELTCVHTASQYSIFTVSTWNNFLSIVVAKDPLISSVLKDGSEFRMNRKRFMMFVLDGRLRQTRPKVEQDTLNFEVMNNTFSTPNTKICVCMQGLADQLKHLNTLTNRCYEHLAVKIKKIQHPVCEDSQSSTS